MFCLFIFHRIDLVQEYWFNTISHLDHITLQQLFARPLVYILNKNSFMNKKVPIFENFHQCMCWDGNTKRPVTMVLIVLIPTSWVLCPCKISTKSRPYEKIRPKLTISKIQCIVLDLNCIQTLKTLLRQVSLTVDSFVKSFKKSSLFMATKI
jgi:hypothetical protein